jgi:Holliday junction DNA helicase RuvB
MRLQKRFINPESQTDDRLDQALRPKSLSELIGQERVKENLAILISAARQRNEPLDHVLFYGPPGLGKTTLAHLLANEMQVNIKITSGPAIERPGDLAAILTNLRAGDILFIDEIHRLGRAVEEILYPAMEDFALDIVIGKGPSARSIRLKLPHYSIIGPQLAWRWLRSASGKLLSCIPLELLRFRIDAAIVERAARVMGVGECRWHG